MKKYLNIKTQNGIETWETIHREDYKTYREFKKEIINIKQNYSLMGYTLYTSQRKAK